MLGGRPTKERRLEKRDRQANRPLLEARGEQRNCTTSKAGSIDGQGTKTGDWYDGVATTVSRGGPAPRTLCGPKLVKSQHSQEPTPLFERGA